MHLARVMGGVCVLVHDFVPATPPPVPRARLVPMLKSPALFAPLFPCTDDHLVAITQQLDKRAVCGRSGGGVVGWNYLMAVNPVAQAAYDWGCVCTHRHAHSLTPLHRPDRYTAVFAWCPFLLRAVVGPWSVAACRYRARAQQAVEVAATRGVPLRPEPPHVPSRDASAPAAPVSVVLVDRGGQSRQFLNEVRCSKGCVLGWA
jgi:hypothetical protein